MDYTPIRAVNTKSNPYLYGPGALGGPGRYSTDGSVMSDSDNYPRVSSYTRAIRNIYLWFLISKGEFIHEGN